MTAVPIVRVCRLKADFITIFLQLPHNFVTRRVCERIKALLHTKDAEQMKKLLKDLILYKQQVENLSAMTKKKSKLCFR